MSKIIFYHSETCPKCKVLKMKLDQKNIQYESVTDISTMEQLGIKSLPHLRVDDSLLDFGEAISWVKNQEAAE